MNFVTTSVFERLVDAYLAGKRLIVNEGGTSSSKTYSAIQFLIFLITSSKKPLLVSIVSESFPHLRRGAIRDFQNIMGANFEDKRWNKSESIYDFGNNRKLEFFSADQGSKLRGGRRDILFINECNNVTLDAFNELDVRTRLFTIVDFNPVSEFYIHEMKGLPHVAWIHSTFLDAAHVLDESVVNNILSRKDRDPNWWRVYGLGLVGKIEGLCHPFFYQFDTMPEQYDRKLYGLDFGYSMDPAALVEIRVVDDSIFCRQLIYEKGLTNDQIAKRLEEVGVRKGVDIIIADSAEPKSIEEIRLFGYDIRPSTKGSDSVNQGIMKVNQFRQGWSKDSVDCIKEQRNYRWDKDNDGNFIDRPIDNWNHGMDARRYAMSTVVDRKVLPPSVRIEDFKLVWDVAMVPEHECLHYAATAMTDDMALHILAGVWDCVGEILYIYYAESVETITPTVIVPVLSNIMHLNEFYFEKFLANQKMLSDEMGMARVINRELAKAVTRQRVKLREPRRYDPYGAIGLTNQAISQGRLIIHQDCEDMITAMQRWKVEKGKVAVDGLLECLIMLVSELDKKDVMRPALTLGGYKKLYEFNY